ncbi:MAG: trifunctional transcriptional regulator/proline dehydrogenase/L-glutamate gamma-semialdehyde dehydrogenase [Proteobacteria bacterium]|nr:trifunctional transcriptional regulator/proline dehydrogenase/L-glutamate gamma-semialdehyde dehydrogenase [Pseudomonadota bacterium]
MDPTPPAASRFAPGPAAATALRQRISDATRMPEPDAVAARLAEARTPAAQSAAATALATTLAQRLRERDAAPGRSGLVQSLLQEYALSSQEGIALMCLAEALLRIPDAATRDALIRDKIARGQWQQHAGRSPSLFVNAATWGLFLTGKLVASHSEDTLSTVLTRLIARGGEPLIRKAVDMGMRMMGEQFVTGETIADALDHARDYEARGFRYSYDMLGEAAMTAADADHYRRAYEDAIHAIGKASAGRGVYAGPGISIKLSALHPRYSRAQYERVMDELYPVVRDLTALARRYDIGLNIDAEEADRLELSLDLLERLCFEPALAGWNGIGFVIQAYQKRCPYVIDAVIDLARRSGHRLMIRLVKGAYWDSEIKRAQVDGQDGFPVYTRKVYTDVAYLACARKLLAAPDAVYPQFATHNAHTMAAIYTLADPSAWAPGQYEFQCLHGMGEPLYEQVVGPASEGKLDRPCRIYAPVGTHETLLAYLVRRLLENGANTSFVHRIADATVPIATLVEDPVASVERMAADEGALGLPHPAIPQPSALYAPSRVNSQGLDLANEATLAALDAVFVRSRAAVHNAEPLLAAPASSADDPGEPVRNPADSRDVVGYVRNAGVTDVDAALAAAAAFAPAWAVTAPATRAAALLRAADALQADIAPLASLMAREAGKTFANGVAEVREAVDFLRYYAETVARDFDAATHRPLGPVVCISPWNFPLAIFTGQVAAALAAGNTVLAKPAEQTPLTAAAAVRALHAAGIPRAALQLLPGDGAVVGAALVADNRVQGVMFTGSTEVARLLQRSLAGRLGPSGAPIPLIAETGGQNAMIVDSSALAEQVVADALTSAFDSAGQRCSALRLLCVQDDVADRVLEMLRGAMAELRIGVPSELVTDVGPVIDAEAKAGIERHVDAMRARGRRVATYGRHAPGVLDRGTFVAPTLIEIESVDELTHEVFGPVLHVVRYARHELDALLAAIAATGYGLTMGLHTRIDETIARVDAAATVGNLYVNRNIVGAVVAVQPFGGEGLSGTGPKAGGPLYLPRLLSARPQDALRGALDRGLPGSAAAPAASHDDVPPALTALAAYAGAIGDARLAAACDAARRARPSSRARVLAGPTGERNTYALHARMAALCLADDDGARLAQLAAVLAAGTRAVWPATTSNAALRKSLPEAVRDAISLAADWRDDAVAFDVVLVHGSDDAVADVTRAVARRAGPIVSVRRTHDDAPGAVLDALFVERSTSVNTAAAGGNATLMTLG